MKKKQINIVKKKIVADFLTPVSAYSRFRSNPYSFLLESVEHGYAGRYSFIGINASRVFYIYQDSIKIFKNIEGEFLEEETVEISRPMEWVSDLLSRYELDQPAGDMPFNGGLVGYLNYEIISSWEKIEFNNKWNSEDPVGAFLFADEFIAFDHLFNTADIVKLTIDDEAEEENESAALARIEEIVDILEHPVPRLTSFSLDRKEELEIESNFTKEEFEEGVMNIKKDIINGEIIQGVFSQCLQTEVRADTFSYYRALRIINPSPYMFYIRFDDYVLCGSSPEVLVKLEGDKATVRPIAGTRPRGKDEKEEQELADDLKSDKKEIAEHIMLVDLGRNDLGRVCRAGTVFVRKLMEIEKYSHVMHMVSDVEGLVKEGCNAVDVFKSCFPAGTVSGAPKLRAIEIVDREENRARGIYAGAVGYFSFSGDMDTCIAIRTMVIKNGKVYVQAGAGIVYDSVPEKEYYETMNKARALLEAVRLGANAGPMEVEDDN